MREAAEVLKTRPASFPMWRFLRRAMPVIALTAFLPLATDLRAQGLLDAAAPLQSGSRGGAQQPPAPPPPPEGAGGAQPRQLPQSQLQPAAPAAQSGGSAAPNPTLQGRRVVFGAPPGGLPQRIRSFLPRGSATDDGRSAPNVQSASGQDGEFLREAGVQLRRMPVNLHGYRLRGEIDATEWPVYLTDSDARSRLRFRVSYLTAISVMPEASVLTLVVNDVVLGQTNLQAPSGTRYVVFDIPPELMRPGWNSIRLTADMRHRVDCSLGATYELWTQIDAANTGLLVSDAPNRVLDAQDVASLAPDSFGAFPVRAVIPGRTTIGNMDQVMKAVQGVALRGRFLQPVVDMGPAALGDAGMNLLVGVYKDIARQPGVEGLGAVTGPRVALLPAGAGRRPMLVVTGQNDQDLAEALESLAKPEEARGSPSGLAALANYRGLRVPGAGRISLRQLNIPSVEFNGRLFRVAFDLVLPPDFYTSDYAKVRLRLDGGYVAGLGPEPQISISVNGRDAATTVLARRDGEVFRSNEIPFPLGRLKPGFNRVEILARVPSPADKTCDPVAAIGAPKRFLLLDSSELIIPTLARVADMPNLALYTSAAFPLTLGERTQLFLPSPDKSAVGAAATLAAQMALAADMVIDLDVTVTPPADSKRSTLVVAPAGALSDATLAAVGVDAAALKSAWANRQNPAAVDPAGPSTYAQLARQRTALTRNLPGYCMMPKVSDAGVVTPRLEAQAPPGAGRAGLDTTALPDRDVLAQWNENIYGRTSLLAQVRGLFNNIVSLGAGMASGAKSLVQDASGKTRQTIQVPPPTSLVMAQSVLTGGSAAALTLVTAPNGADLFDATACLTDPLVWSQVSGQKTLLDAASGEVTTIAPRETYFMPTTVFSVVNARLVAASWLSHNPSVYVVSSLLVAIFLGGATTWLLRNIGRKQ
ncbi:hypothetical protein GCM10019059_01070 [Camelimonas fluminis]|nr:hypothetical protein GCM10019059_01070 [Camelimonas fluminis]